MFSLSLIFDSFIIVCLGKISEFLRVPMSFELWCWRRLLRVPWTAGRSNQSILKEISPGCSLEGLMLKLKLQYFGHLMQELTHWKRPWCWEGLGAGGEGDHRGWDGWMASPTRWAWVWVNSGSLWWTGRPGMLWFMRLQRVRYDWAAELNWTDKFHELGYLNSWEKSKVHSLPSPSLCPCIHTEGIVLRTSVITGSEDLLRRGEIGKTVLEGIETN